MPDNFNKYNINYAGSSDIDTKDIGMAIEEMITVAKNRRKIFERRWYDIRNVVVKWGELLGSLEQVISSRARKGRFRDQSCNNTHKYSTVIKTEDMIRAS